jgi:S1-C subfamily serine protease
MTPILSTTITRRQLLAAALVAPVAVAAGRSGAAAQDGALPPERSAVEVVEAVAPAVVTVINEVTSTGAGGIVTEEAGSGTGFIISEDGYIVTNAHVVEGGDRFTVLLADGEARPAELIGADRISDLAVVQIQGRVPGVVPFGDSDLLMPGQSVLAIGSPLGAFTNTVTMGIVSATARDFPASATYTNLVQHDAAINPGNSGGPLISLRGEVVGVNTLGIPESASGPVQGIFFAIPSNDAARITSILIADGRMVYPYFGIVYETVTPQLMARYDLPVTAGALIVEIAPGGPAEEAGLLAGDIVIALADEPITRENLFSELLFRHAPGETISVSYVRNGRERTTDLTLIERPENI